MLWLGPSAPKPALIPINYTLPFLTHPPAVRTTPKVWRFLKILMSSIRRPSLQENVWSDFFSALMFVCWRALLDHYCYIFGCKCRGSPKRQNPNAAGKRNCFLWSYFQQYVGILDTKKKKKALDESCVCKSSDLCDYVIISCHLVSNSLLLWLRGYCVSERRNTEQCLRPW